MIPIGPFATTAIWIAISIAIARHNATATERGVAHLPLFELVPIAVAIIMVQLLLDLHRPYVGDLGAIAVHVIGGAALWLRRRAR